MNASQPDQVPQPPPEPAPSAEDTAAVIAVLQATVGAGSGTESSGRVGWPKVWRSRTVTQSDGQHR